MAISYWNDGERAYWPASAEAADLDMSVTRLTKG
jgi:hypothetical protein